jgi:ABC-type transport system substrate-binding protein
LNKNWQIVTLGFADLVFPNEPSPFHDLRVREAVSLAIDRKAICEKILNSGADPWGDVHSQQTLGYDPANQPDPYDPRKARALLREAGYPNGFETKIHTAATWKRELEAVAANLAAVGIKAKLEVYEWGAWAAAHRGKKMRGLFRQHLTFNTDRHPGSQLTTQQDPQSPWSYGLSTPEINEIIAKSMHAKTDEDLMSFGKKLSKVMRERRANVILWSTSSGYGLGPRIAEWVHQESTYPCTAFEYLKVKEGK